VVSGYALIGRLVGVSTLPYNRLGGPVGYWNALGILAAAGVCVGVAVVAHEPRRLSRAVAGCALPILVGALYLTFSRGSWLALGAGLAVLAGTDPRRRELAGAAVALVLPCVFVLACEASAHALTTPAAPHGAVTADAHRVAVAVLLMSALSARLAVLGPRLSAWLPRLAPRRSVVAAVACAVVVAVVAVGGPPRLLSAAGRAFDAAPPNSANNLNTHLLSLSGSWRGELWHVALTSFARHPLAGNGAGTYGRLWLQKRPEPLMFEDAHSVYLETLTELGAVGLALLLAVLVAPLIAARRALRHAYIPALTAAYVAFLGHAAIDWDWEMPVVMMGELVCGATIVAAARGELRPLRRRARIGGLAAASCVGGLTLVFLVGNRDLSTAATAAANGQHTLDARARAAETWAPWSPDPPRWLATVQLDDGHRAAARKLLAAAIGKDRTDWSLWLEMAAASDGQARISAIREAQRLDPNSPELFQAAVQYGLIARPRPGH
jgi:O-Antigen ligase